MFVRVFVLGGTGAVGRPAVRALIAADHRVDALARSAEKAAELEACGARPVEVSMYDEGGLRAAFDGHDAVVNLATALPSTGRMLSIAAWSAAHRLRMVGSSNVVDAALAAGVGRLLQESVVMVYPDGGSSWIDETVPHDVYAHARGNLCAEASARRFTDAGRVGVVLRFGVFYGRGADHSEELASFARRHVSPVIGRGDGYVSSIHVTDAASAVTAALAVDSGTYNVVDDEPLTKRANARALSDAVGAKAWAHPPGRAATLLGTRTTALTRSLRVSNAKLRATADWAPRYPSAREGWVATARSLDLVS